MKTPFRTPFMRRVYETCVDGYNAKSGTFFLNKESNVRRLGSSTSVCFWRGFDDTDAASWDAASRSTLAYAAWRAGKYCASLKEPT